MSPRLLFVLNDPRFFLTHRLPLAVAARDAGYAVSVAAPWERGAAEVEARGFPVRPIPLERQGQNPVADARLVAALARLYRSDRPDIVHHVTIKPVLYGTLAARLAGVPGVVNAIAGLGQMFAPRGALSRARAAAIRMMYRALARHPNAIAIFQNEEDRDFFLRAGIVGRDRTVLVNGSGVDVREFRPGPEPDGAPTVVLTARLLRQKGVAEFAEAARRLRDEGVAARFALVGDGAGNRDAIPRGQLEQWEREGLLELWGWRTDMPAVMRQTTIACLPSYYREGIPKALLDAAASGRPIVTTDVTGCREVVADGVNGFLVPPRDVDALVDALRRLLLDPALRRRFGAAGREMAERRFSVDAVQRGTLDAYARLLDQRPAAAAPASVLVATSR